MAYDIIPIELGSETNPYQIPYIQQITRVLVTTQSWGICLSLLGWVTSDNHMKLLHGLQGDRSAQFPPQLHQLQFSTLLSAPPALLPLEAPSSYAKEAWLV